MDNIVSLLELEDCLVCAHMGKCVNSAAVGPLIGQLPARVQILACTERKATRYVIVSRDLCAAGTSWAISFRGLFSTMQLKQFSSFCVLPREGSFPQGSVFFSHMGVPFVIIQEKAFPHGKSNI
jgi:hypothetical protein